MAFGTATIAFTPGYATIGLLAPLMVVAGRLVQGFSAGVELGGVSVYLAEIATPGNKGFYCSWQSASQQVAVIFASLVGVSLNYLIPAEQMTRLGLAHSAADRLPDHPVDPGPAPLAQGDRGVRGAKAPSDRRRGLAPDRRQLDGRAARHSAVRADDDDVLSHHRLYPDFRSAGAAFRARDNLIVTLCVGFSNFFWLPIGGAISDRIGRRPMLLALAAIALITAYPAMCWLVSEPSFARLLLVQLWFSFIFGTYNGALIPFLTEMMPPLVRTSGFSLAFSLATALFGGLTPAISTYLIHATGNPAMPGAWLSVAAILALGAALISRPYILPGPAPARAVA